MRKTLSYLLILIVLVQVFDHTIFALFWKLDREFLVANFCEQRDNEINLCTGRCILTKFDTSISDGNPNELWRQITLLELFYLIPQAILTYRSKSWLLPVIFWRFLDRIVFCPVQEIFHPPR